MSTIDGTRGCVEDGSDADLVAASEADPVAFDVLFDRHVAAIHGYLCRRVGPSLAEELTAETFARAFELRERFVSPDGRAAPWLYGIATNLIRNAWRAERRRLAAYGRARSAVPVAPDDLERADERIDAARAAARAASAIMALEPGDRDALVLFAWEELTYVEIGAALGIPPGTVGSRINRARRLVRAALTRHDSTDGAR